MSEIQSTQYCVECVRLAAERDELQQRSHQSWEAARKAEAERDRIASANDTLVARIEDLTEGYALEDTCPRVQCQTTSQRLHRDLAQVTAERYRYRHALERIAAVNREKRPDGSYNHDRNALIDIAEDVLKGGSDE